MTTETREELLEIVHLLWDKHGMTEWDIQCEMWSAGMEWPDIWEIL